jgi:hypothetical protein
MSRKNKYGKNNKTTKKWHDSPNITNAIKIDVAESRKKRNKMVIFVVLNILAVWGVVLTTWVVFNPRVFVLSSGVALDPNNPAFSPFFVQNQGYLAIYDVNVSCSVKYLKLPGDIHVVGIGDYTNRFSDPKQVASVIAPGEQYTILLPLTGMKHNKIEDSDIAIVLSFKPQWLPWRRKTIHRFISTRSKDGQWYWFQQPIKK